MPEFITAERTTQEEFDRDVKTVLILGINRTSGDVITRLVENASDEEATLVLGAMAEVFDAAAAALPDPGGDGVTP
jgi:hypothetical protein